MFHYVFWKYCCTWKVVISVKYAGSDLLDGSVPAVGRSCSGYTVAAVPGLRESTCCTTGRIASFWNFRNQRFALQRLEIVQLQ